MIKPAASDSAAASDTERGFGFNVLGHDSEMDIAGEVVQEGKRGRRKGSWYSGRGRERRRGRDNFKLPRTESLVMEDRVLDLTLIIYVTPR